MVKKVIFLFVAVFLLALGLVSASQSQNYSDLGNITADSSVYSCWPSCTAYVNLTIETASSFAGDNLTVSLNNSATSSVNFAIYWKNDTGSWSLQGNNDSFINNSNLNLTGTVQLMINITLSSPLSTKWNVSFNVNGTDYVLDPYLDSIALNSPANNNVTDDQTPNFNFTLFSGNAAKQSCTLYLSYNNTGTWTSSGTNSSTINGSSTIITPSSMGEGNYTWKIICNVTGTSGVRWIYVDDTNPPTMSSLSVAASSTTATVTWITNENANSSVRYGGTLSLSEGARNYVYTDKTSHSIELIDLATSTNYYYNATSCDSANNCATSSGTFTTSSYTTVVSGGYSVQTQSKSKTWTRLVAGETGSWNVNSHDLGLKQLNLTVINESKSVRLSISRILVLSSSIPKKSGEVYRYIKIESSNINGLDAALIKLQIEKTWMQNNSFNQGDISLFRFDNSSSEWKKINTEFDSEDSKYYYFNSETDSFSYFAIVGEKTSAESSPSSSTSSTSQSDVSSAENVTGDSSEDEGSSRTGIIIMIIIIAVAAIGAVAFIIYSQLFKKKGR